MDCDVIVRCDCSDKEAGRSDPTSRERRGLRGGEDGGSRNADHMLVGMKVQKLIRDARVGRLAERIYTITGVDRVQAVAYDVMDELGRFLK